MPFFSYPFAYPHTSLSISSRPVSCSSFFVTHSYTTYQSFGACPRSTLLKTIKGFYAAAVDRLPVGEMPPLVPRPSPQGRPLHQFLGPHLQHRRIVLNIVSFCSRHAPDRKPVAAALAPKSNKCDDSDDSDEGETKREEAVKR